MSRAAPDRIVGRRLFTDGVQRPVYEDANGDRFVSDDDGQRIEGVWLLPAD
jgi:hypothetical protein